MNNRIKEIRSYFKLSRSAFGERIGVSGDVINNLERGRVDIKEHMLKLISAEFGVNEDWLRNGFGDMFTETQEDYLNGLSQRYHLDDLAKSILEGYLSLKPEHRDVIKNYILSVAEKYQKLQETRSEIDQEEEAYRKELEAEAKGAAGLSQSEKFEDGKKVI